MLVLTMGVPLMLALHLTSIRTLARAAWPTGERYLGTRQAATL